VSFANDCNNWQKAAVGYLIVEVADIGELQE